MRACVDLLNDVSLNFAAIFFPLYIYDQIDLLLIYLFILFYNNRMGLL